MQAFHLSKAGVSLNAASQISENADNTPPSPAENQQMSCQIEDCRLTDSHYCEILRFTLANEIGVFDRRQSRTDVFFKSLPQIVIATSETDHQSRSCTTEDSSSLCPCTFLLIGQRHARRRATVQSQSLTTPHVSSTVLTTSSIQRRSSGVRATSLSTFGSEKVKETFSIYTSTACILDTMASLH